MDDIKEVCEKIRSIYKRGEVVLLGNQKAIFVGIGVNLTAELYFENGNTWGHKLEKIKKYNGDVKKDLFARKLKLKFYHIKDFRRNFSNFL